MKNEPRIQIQDLSPVVDCGRYAAKACVGDDVRVEATIFRDGHELLGAELRTKEPGARRWRTTPMTELGARRDGHAAAPRHQAGCRRRSYRHM